MKKVPADKHQNIVPILVFRASLVFLPAIFKKIPDSPIGFVGLKRDEKTAVADKYYSQLPPIYENSIVVIFDPMLGTCGTLRQAHLEASKKFESTSGYFLGRENVYYVGFVAAESGYRKALNFISKKNIILLAIDPGLDSSYFIVPGLGDFGDRFFGN